MGTKGGPGSKTWERSPWLGRKRLNFGPYNLEDVLGLLARWDKYVHTRRTVVVETREDWHISELVNTMYRVS